MLDQGSRRRAELLGIAAQLFAEHGYRSTTVRDIAEAAGILSGSLYHHFDSKESIADEILSGFLDELFASYTEILAAGLKPRNAIEAVIIASFEAIDSHPHGVSIYQTETKHLAKLSRFDYLEHRNTEFRKLWTTMLSDGVRQGAFREDLDIEVVYRFIRDTVWVAVHWYNPNGSLPVGQVARQYLTIVLEGIAVRRRPAKRGSGT
ncbi:TetR/AcrR family transcriptional regulator [Amycolatopsis rhizosphaerae]|uniref:TetR/AcrR family transcriptional regulator n=1 Tax=Amycolatopsis rhizosphaerae TaxID=2053003 RepID=A0A558DK10_9PSEU|nr:TetR/AcrR family transcriptional regulator [Amycolatopsis rhizosphaerae]TVT61343.1 TetR/AcrR family transcriptional regulator [Amycolatopsis rhizosphaerae]